jgi:hypothetical protein
MKRDVLKCLECGYQMFPVDRIHYDVVMGGERDVMCPEAYYSCPFCRRADIKMVSPNDSLLHCSDCMIVFTCGCPHSEKQTETVFPVYNASLMVGFTENSTGHRNEGMMVFETSDSLERFRNDIASGLITVHLQHTCGGVRNKCPKDPDHQSHECLDSIPYDLKN